MRDLGEFVHAAAGVGGLQGVDADRQAALGLTTVTNGDEVIVDDVAFDSPAQKVGMDWDQKILLVRAPNEAPSKYWMYIPAFAALALVIWLQRRRMTPEERAGGSPAVA